MSRGRAVLERSSRLRDGGELRSAGLGMCASDKLEYGTTLTLNRNSPLYPIYP